MQTDAATHKWPASEEACERLVKSFRSKHALHHQDDAEMERNSGADGSGAVGDSSAAGDSSPAGDSSAVGDNSAVGDSSAAEVSSAVGDSSVADDSSAADDDSDTGDRGSSTSTKLRKLSKKVSVKA